MRIYYFCASYAFSIRLFSLSLFSFSSCSFDFGVVWVQASFISGFVCLVLMGNLS